MPLFNKYLIKTTDRFDPDYFSSINEEVTAINTRAEKLPAVFKEEIIISFLKDHSIHKTWISANPELAELVTSGTLFTGNIEALFASSSNNPGYRQDLENYLRERFTETIISKRVD